MRVVLEESWRLLSPAEQQQFARLTVFSGSFTAEANLAVTDAPLDTLATLVEKSLLRRGSDGRFQLHELLRQFAAEQLAASADEETRTRARHSAYYLAFLTRLGPALLGEHQPMALDKISVEIGNIRAAWGHAVATADLGAIDRGIDVMYEFFSLGCRYQEGEEAFALAATQLASQADQGTDTCRIQMRAAARHGAFSYFLGMYDLARERLQTCLRTARTLGLAHEEAFALDLLGQIAGWQGDYPEAMALLEQSLTISRAIDDTQHTAGVLQEIAVQLWDRGEFAEVQRLYAESLTLSRRTGRPDRIGGALDGMGAVAFCLGQYAAVELHYREALAVFEHSQHQLGVAKALGGLGLVRWAQGGAVHESIPYFEQSLAMMRAIGHQRHKMERMNDLARAFTDLGEADRAMIYGREGLAAARELGSPVYVANSLCCLAWAAITAGDRESARAFLREAVVIAAQGGLSPVLAEALLYCAELLIREGTSSPEQNPGTAQGAAALALVEVALRHPMWHIFKERAQHLKADLEVRLPAEAVARTPDLAMLAADVTIVVRWLDAIFGS
jgi:tetratricopeptide (TPR) repeat protein